MNGVQLCLFTRDPSGCSNPCRATKARTLALTKLGVITRSRQLPRGRYAYYGDSKGPPEPAYVVIDSLKSTIEAEKRGAHAFSLYDAAA